MQTPDIQIEYVTNNQYFKENFTSQAADEKALTSYFELLSKYPKLKREGDLNNFKKGTYQIVYDEKTIKEIQKECYDRLYTKALSQGLSPFQASELAANYSRPGVVSEDQFWIWIRDVVISPSGFRHTYNRIVWKCDLERIGGAAALPIVIDQDKNVKIVIILAFRHATNSWEFEMPRGASKANETSMETAQREILEETGCKTDVLIPLGSITPDSGLTASIVPIFAGKVVKENDAKHDKTEAIKGKYAFTREELMDGYKRGYITIDIDGKATDVPLRDPFLAYALLMAEINHLL